MSFSRKLGALGIAAVAAAAVAGCSSGGGGVPVGGAAPAWAKTLGTGVTVKPGNAAPNDGSPGGVLLGEIQDIQSGNYKGACNYEPPSEQSECSSELSKLTPAQLKSAVPIPRNMAVTYTAIKGTEALVGLTGTICASGKCTTNSDPAAIFDSGKTFDDLWQESSSASSDVYSLSQLAQVNGKWYLAGSSS